VYPDRQAGRRQASKQQAARHGVSSRPHLRTPPTHPPTWRTCSAASGRRAASIRVVRELAETSSVKVSEIVWAICSKV
jgi:hypothetical protein